MADTHDGRHEMARKRVLYDLPGTAQVDVRRGIPYAATDAGELTFDVYRPSHPVGLLPVVVFVTGVSDIGAREQLGCRINEMEAYISWGRLVAASGMAAVTYTTDADPAANGLALLSYLRSAGGALGLDTNRLGMWAGSGNVLKALDLVHHERTSIRSAVFCYGLMRPLDLPAEVPLLVVRAGRDETPGFNESIDLFVAAALQRNLALTLINHSSGRHAFDLQDDSAATRAVVAEILRFLATHLSADPQGGASR